MPGLDPLALALSGKSFVPSPEAEAFLSNQIDALRAQRGVGPKILALVNAYAAGINGYYASKGIPAAPFTANDVVASAALIAARFGTNGGQEVGNAMFLDALRDRLGDADARRVFADLRESNDPEAPVSLPGSFPQEAPSAATPGSALLDDGSFTGAALAAPAFASNALLVGAKRSQTGHPLFVAGPQVGYFFPEFFAEMELTGAGFNVRGAVFPGVPLVLVGRGPDYAWSATSSQADNLDLFVETLCDDDVHYFYRGQCEPMRRFFAGTLKAQGQADQEVSYEETTHGPVIGYAKVGGKRVAISVQRSTRGRELLSTKAFYDLNTARVTSAKDFLSTMNGVEFSFNWFYADDRDIALFSSGRLPIRSPGTDPALPTIGNGDYDWRGFVPFAGHAQGINPASGTILNWNNRPAANVGAADSNFSYGSVHRVDLLRAAVAGRKKHSLATLTGAMNKAATQDLRVVRVWPIIRAVLQTGPGAECARGGGGRSPRQLAHERIEPARSRARRQGRRSRRCRDGRGVAAARRRRDDPGPRPARRSAGGAAMAAATTRTPVARRTSRAGTGTSTRICGRFSDARCAGRTRVATAERAFSRRAAKRSGPRSTGRPPSSSRSRGLRRQRGARTRRASGSGSRRACSPTPCAGRTGRPSSS